ncbi:MAG: carbonic anhydrase [Phycisphaerales bacterium]|nr:carbonic anhydrase [Phycisphaerales bacterium]
MGRTAAKIRASQPTADEGVRMLMEGNKRFISGEMNPHDFNAMRKQLVDSQAPFAIILRCADSRVSPEIVFDQGIGDIFVCAVAGNIPTPEIVASMEYSIAVLGSPLIVVMGHSSCGAVDAAIKNFDSLDDLPGSLPGLIGEILPAVINTKGEEGDVLDNTIRENVRLAMKRLPKMSDIIQEAHAKGSLKIIGGVYELGTGQFVPVEG